MELTRRIVAVVAMAALAYPPGATSVMRWAADHDMVDVPWVRDCHGIYRHPDECPSRSEARSISY
jgi:hypothetical protein